MGMTEVDPREVARRWVERTCKAQRITAKVADRGAIGTIAVLLGQSRQTGSMRSGSKRARPRTARPTTARSSTAATIAR
jgi:hypothetical protein